MVESKIEIKISEVLMFNLEGLTWTPSVIRRGEAILFLTLLPEKVRQMIDTGVAERQKIIKIPKS